MKLKHLIWIPIIGLLIGIVDSYRSLFTLEDGIITEMKVVPLLINIALHSSSAIVMYFLI